MKTTFNNTVFNRKRRQFKGADASFTDSVQVCLEMAFDHYAAHTDTGKLTLIMKDALQLRTKRATSSLVKRYIQDHCNVTWKVSKKEGARFVKDADAELAVVVEPEATYYDYKQEEDDNKEPTLVDPETRIKSLRTVINKAIEDGLITAGKEDIAKQFVELAGDLVA